jgi:hypothetical protein
MLELTAKGTVSEILTQIKETFESASEIWFRGQPRFEFDLRPGIFRQGTKYGHAFYESKMYTEFQRRHPEVHADRDDIVEWLPIMQHFGLPTRLLDWTTNLLVALYFCCRQDTDDGALFAFDPAKLTMYEFNPLLKIQIEASGIGDFYKLLIYRTEGILDDDSLINEVSIGEIKNDIALQARFTHITAAKKTPLVSLHMKTTLQRTVDLDGNPIPFVHQDITRALSNIVAVRPRHLSDRIKLQHGCFTLHGGAFFDGHEFIPLGDTDTYMQGLTKMRVPAVIKPCLLRELEICGIREATLFPEMENQARDIKNRFTTELKVGEPSNE